MAANAPCGAGADEREQVFHAGLAELHSFLSMADARLRRLSEMVAGDSDRTAQVAEIRRCLDDTQRCIELHWRWRDGAA